jgi:hypothetical protein
MEPFAVRMGFEEPDLGVQVDDMDTALRNGLWNAFYVVYVPADARTQHQVLANYGFLYKVVVGLWTELFKGTSDTIPFFADAAVRGIRKEFFDADWKGVYGIIEFLAVNYPATDVFVEECNRVLERDRSAYRFAGPYLTQVADERDLATIQRALRETADGKLRHVHEQLATAARMLGDREDPDYRNSVKEAISAVEGVVNIVGGKKATLGTAIKKADPKIHKAFADGLSKLYGWTSDDSGIRHALMDESTVELEDAQFMLVLCSGFVSFLVAKAARAGLLNLS